ncbi:MAG: DUF4199 domain-containing protein [Hellea sp.]
MSNTKRALGFWKTAFFYGFATGLLIICSMVGSFIAFGMQSGASSMAVGFLLMFLYMSLIFFGIKRFRNIDQGGVIAFSKALLLGASMAFFSALAYVLVWEIYIAYTGDTFIIGYTDMLLEKAKAKGMSGAELSDYTSKMKDYVTNYERTSYRMPMTFLENFPMGFIVALISALSLHNPKFWARK